MLLIVGISVFIHTRKTGMVNKIHLNEDYRYKYS